MLIIKCMWVQLSPSQWVLGVCFTSGPAPEPLFEASWLFLPLLRSQVKQHDSSRSVSKVIKGPKGKEKAVGSSLQHIGLSYLEDPAFTGCLVQLWVFSCFLAQGIHTLLLWGQRLLWLSTPSLGWRSSNSLFPSQDFLVLSRVLSFNDIRSLHDLQVWRGRAPLS